MFVLKTSDLQHLKKYNHVYSVLWNSKKWPPRLICDDFKTIISNYIWQALLPVSTASFVFFYGILI